MHINISDLSAISQRLFQHLEEQGLDSIDIDIDYYWNIPKDQVYEPYQKPSDLDLGQLTDDWYELQKMLTSESKPISYCFVWLASILRVIGEEVIA